jgi:hypothetical protein
MASGLSVIIDAIKEPPHLPADEQLRDARRRDVGAWSPAFARSQ